METSGWQTVNGRVNHANSCALALAALRTYRTKAPFISQHFIPLRVNERSRVREPQFSFIYAWKRNDSDLPGRRHSERTLGPRLQKWL